MDVGHNSAISKSANGATYVFNGNAVCGNWVILPREVYANR